MLTLGAAGPRSRMIGARGAMFGTTPGDVLAYRAMWDSFVLQTACGLYVLSWMTGQMAATGTAPTQAQTAAQIATGTPTTNGTACAQSWFASVTGPLLQFSHTLSQQELQSIATATSDMGDSIIADWNAFQGFDDYAITAQAQVILEGLQNAVTAAISNGRTTLATFSPGIAAAIVQGPDTSTQAQVIAQIEGAGIMAAGYLKVFSLTSLGVVQGAASAAQTIASLGKQTSWLLSPWTWLIAGTMLVGTTVVVVYNSEKIAKLVAAAKPI